MSVVLCVLVFCQLQRPGAERTLVLGLQSQNVACGGGNGAADLDMPRVRTSVIHIRHAHAASPVPSDTTGEHATSTPVLVRPRGRAPPSESDVRELTPPTPGPNPSTLRIRDYHARQKVPEMPLSFHT